MGIGAVAAILLMAPAARGQSEDLVLIDRELRRQPVRDLVIDRSAVRFRDASGAPQVVALEECIGLIQAPGRAPGEGDPRWARADGGSATGLLILTDGQRLPGSIATSAPPDRDDLGWTHAWLGRVDVPLERISAVTFRPGHAVPEPTEADLVVLHNGDRIEGFITELGDPIAIEARAADGSVNEIRIPFGRAAAVALVTPRRDPAERRVWFRDGTLLDTDRLLVGDDGYLRLATVLEANGTPPVQVRLSDATAMLFDAAGFVPLGTLTPSRVDTDAPRFVVPPPRRLDRQAPLGLGRLEYRGPLRVRYALPAGAGRFAAKAVLPRAARAWGDLELVVSDEETVVFRTRLNAARPTADINVPIEGSELTIELREGAHGPIQDHVVLWYAALLVE